MENHSALWNPRQTVISRDYEVFHGRSSSLEDTGLLRHDFFEVYLFLGGSVLYRIENSRFPLKRGDLLVISPGEMHQPMIMAAAPPYERVVLRLDRHSVKELSRYSSVNLHACFDAPGTPYDHLIHLSDQDLGTFMNLFEIMLREQKDARYGQDAMRRCCVIQILLFVNRLTAQWHAALAGDDQDELVDRVFAYINAHILEDISLEKLEKMFYFDSSTLTRRFKKQLDTTISQYIREKRLVIARDLMSQGHQPSQVYLQCGFADYSGFFRAFKHQCGMSPREYYQSILSP